MKKILFVDDDVMVLDTIHKLFQEGHKDWDLRFAHDGSEALQLLERQPADVVVTDMRMPKMNGAVLLNEVMQRYPKTVRFILSGFADMELAMYCVAGTHQFLSKPADIATLESTVQRAVEMDNWLNNDQIKTLVSQLTSVPSVPALYFQILKELRSPETTMENVGAIIAQDPGMTVKILQLANSAFFGLGSKLANPTEAVMQLGFQTVKSLVLAIHIFSELDSNKDARFRVGKIHHHCFATAVAARQIAQFEHQQDDVAEAAFTAGLLHDIGRLVLISNLPDQYAEAVNRSQRESIPLVDAERAVFGATHAEAGGYLMGLWGLPGAMVEAAVFHHRPRTCPGRGFSPLTAVHVANVLEQNQENRQPAALAAQLDMEYLAEVGVADKIPQWIETVSKGHAE